MDAPKSYSESMEASVAAMIAQIAGRTPQDDVVVRAAMSNALQEQFDYFGRDVVVYTIKFDTPDPSQSRLVSIQRYIAKNNSLGTATSIKSGGVLPLATYQNRYGAFAALSMTVPTQRH